MALGILGTADAYDRELILRFFDSHSAPVRQSGWQWLVGVVNGNHSSPGCSDAGLWCRLLETPYDDLRCRWWMSWHGGLRYRAPAPTT